MSISTDRETILEADLRRLGRARRETRWEQCEVSGKSRKLLEQRLREGWEPYAVAFDSLTKHVTHYLKRQVKEER